MKLLISMFCAVCLLTACNSESNKQAALLRAKQATVDSMKVVLAKKAVIDSMNSVMAINEEKNRQSVANHNALAATTGAVAVTSSTSPITAPNVTTSPRYAAAKRKKKWNNTAKGAVIGAGAGAVTGAIVSKKRGKGAIIGGLIGGGAGAGTGLVIDHAKSKRN